MHAQEVCLFEKPSGCLTGSLISGQYIIDHNERNSGGTLFPPCGAESGSFIVFKMNQILFDDIQILFTCHIIILSAMIAGSQAACSKAMVCFGPHQSWYFVYNFAIGKPIY